MREWLASASQPELTEDAYGYLLGRGMREQTIHSLGITLWMTPPSPCPDAEFSDKYKGGRYLDDRIVCPALSPRGALIGFEARTWRPEDGKRMITDFRLPEAAWNPFFLGLTAEAMARVWAGCDLWLVEGLFDLAALERVVPAHDVVLCTVRAKVSEAHVQFIRRLLRKGHMVHMVYDNDETGRKQVLGWVDDTGKKRWGALEVFERVGVPCRQVPYTGGKDPGVIWDQGGDAALRAAFSHIL